jgi:hypothetical protein
MPVLILEGEITPSDLKKSRAKYGFLIRLFNTMSSGEKKEQSEK